MKNRFPYENDAAGEAATIRYASIMNKLEKGKKSEALQLAKNSISDFLFMPEWAQAFRRAAAKAAK